MNECSKKCAHRPERTKSFLTKFFLMDMFILTWGIQFGPPSLEGYTEKTKNIFPGRPKKIRKIKNSFKTILPIAHLGTKEQIWYQGCKISAANKTFPCPKSEVVSQSQHIVFLKVFLWTSKMHVDDSVEKFRQSSNSFGSKCFFDDCWIISAGSSINFAW